MTYKLREERNKLLSLFKIQEKAKRPKKDRFCLRNPNGDHLNVKKKIIIMMMLIMLWREHSLFVSFLFMLNISACGMFCSSRPPTVSF